MAILIYGAGDTGQALVDYLWRKESVFVLDRDDRMVDWLNHSYDVVAHKGDLLDFDFLDQVIQSPPPHALIAVTENHEHNLMAASICKALAPDMRVMVRVDVADYDIQRLERVCGKNSIVSPYHMVSVALIDMLKEPDCWEWAKCRVDEQWCVILRGETISEAHPWKDRSVEEIELNGDIFVARIGQGFDAWVAQKEDRLRVGHYVYHVTMQGENRTKVKVDHVLIFTGGKMGPWLLKEANTLGCDITVVSNDQENLNHAAKNFPEMRLVRAKADDIHTIRDEVNQNSLIVAATDQTNTNIVCANLALGCGARHAVTWTNRVFTPRPDMIQGSGTLVHAASRMINNVHSRLLGDKDAWVYPLMGGMGGELVIKKENDEHEGEKEGREKRGVKMNERSGQLFRGQSAQFKVSEDNCVMLNITSKGYDKNKRQ